MEESKNNNLAHSTEINEIGKAIALAQHEIENAAKKSVNPHFKSSYADLAEVLNVIRPIFSKHGIAIIQNPSYLNGIVSVTTMLVHSSGQHILSTISAPVGKQDAQGVGSAITYCRRYSLAAMAGIAQEDDDGNRSIGSNHKNINEAEFKHDAAILESLQKATDLESLSKAWAAIPVGLRHGYVDAKDFRKSELSAGGSN